MTGLDRVTASLRLLGVIAPGESLSAGEANDALAALNRMLGSWSNEGLLANAIVREEFPLVAAQASYSMGDDADDFDTARPMKIERACIEIQTATPVIEKPVNILTSIEWAAIRVKEITSEIPSDIYPEGTFPNETINVYPVPTTAHKLVLYSWKPFTEIAELSTVVSLPPGYDRALVYNLAIDLAPEYGKTASAEVVATAMESKASIKRMNTKPRFLRVDAALLSSGASFDITRGDT